MEERYNRLRLEVQLAADKAEAVSEAELVRRTMAKEKTIPPVKGFFGAAKCVSSCDCPFAVAPAAGLVSTTGLLLWVPLFFCISSCLDRQQAPHAIQP